MTDRHGQGASIVRDEVDKVWQAVLERLAATGRVSSKEFPFLLPNEAIVQMSDDEAWQAYARKRLFLQYAVEAGKRAGHPLDAFMHELDHMVRALMPFTQRWQAEEEAGAAPALPMLDLTVPEDAQLALVRLYGAVLFPGEEQPVPGRRLLLAPHRGRMADGVLRASATSFESWTEVERADSECRDGLRPLFGTEQSRIVVVPGAASLGIELAVVAASAPGSIVLVLGHGPDGERVADVVSRRGRVADLLSASENGRIDLEVLRARLTETRPNAVVVSHVDEGSGVVAPIDAYAPIINEVAPNALFVVDGTMATGCMPQHADDWHADLVFTDSASSLGGCSGLVLAAVSDRLYERRVRSYAVPLYIELNRWSSPVGADVPPMLIFALRAALRGIYAEGASQRFARCEGTGRAFREQAAAHGFTVVAPAGREAATLTVLAPPEHVMPQDLREQLDHKGFDVGATKAGIVVAHGGGTDDIERFWHAVEALHLQG
jgi:alanine-glyoxylate transaminase/serine-glyoxylate transaminase/serine-pyruvate transaminase